MKILSDAKLHALILQMNKGFIETFKKKIQAMVRVITNIKKNFKRLNTIQD